MGEEEFRARLPQVGVHRCIQTYRAWRERSLSRWGRRSSGPGYPRQESIYILQIYRARAWRERSLSRWGRRSSGPGYPRQECIDIDIQSMEGEEFVQMGKEEFRAGYPRQESIDIDIYLEHGGGGGVQGPVFMQEFRDIDIQTDIQTYRAYIYRQIDRQIEAFLTSQNLTMPTPFLDFEAQLLIV